MKQQSYQIFEKYMQQPFTEIAFLEDQSTEYLQFGYLQALVRKIRLTNNDSDIVKIDNLLTKIYSTHMKLKADFGNTLERLNSVLVQLSQSLNSQTMQKQLLLEYSEQRDALMSQLRESTESNLHLMQENQTMQQMVQKYEQINKGLNENVQILSQSLLKQKELYNLQLRDYIEKVQKQKEDKQQISEGMSTVLEEYHQLITENSSIKNDLVNLNLPMNILSTLNQSSRILFYLATSPSKQIEKLKPFIKETLLKSYPSLSNFTEAEIQQQLKSRFPEIGCQLSETAPQSPTSAPDQPVEPK